MRINHRAAKGERRPKEDQTESHPLQDNKIAKRYNDNSNERRTRNGTEKGRSLHRTKGHEDRGIEDGEGLWENAARK